MPGTGHTGHLGFRPLERIGRLAKPRDGFDEEVENVLGLGAWHDLIDRRNEVEARLPTEFGRHQITHAYSRQNSLRVPGRK